MAEYNRETPDTGNTVLTEAQSSEMMDRTNVEDDGLDVFLERARSDRMFELRRIQHGDRPVTGQGHREQLNSFISKQLEVREHAEATGKENVPLNTQNVEEHRPEAVVVEIQGLSQRQPVSSVLQTAAFRRHLENIIRGSISTVTRNHSPISSQRPSPSPRPTPPRQVLTEQNRVPSPALPQIVEPRRDSISSSSSSATFGSVPSHLQEDRDSVSGESTPSHVSEQLSVTLGQAGQEDRATPERVTWEMVREVHHEEIVHEISELVHRRLVTSTLEGDFRSVLEFHVRDRVQASGTDGERVQSFIQNIPQNRPHIRNDFSEIGLPPAGGDNWDNISIASVSAQAVPYTQTNLYMSRELHSLKAQMEEMKNMLKVSFDLQMDIQRAIRQEVAAAISSALATSGNTSQASPPTAGHIPRSRPVNDTHCLICLENFSDAVLYQCGHMCVCYKCGRSLIDRNANCPICRAPIRDIIRAYRCAQD